MKHAKFWAFALVVAAVSTTGLRAEGSYIGFGLGLQFNLASLGETIVNDGLEAPGAGAAPNLSSTNGAGGRLCLLSNTCPEDTTATSNQKIIIDEKTLAVYNKLTHGGIAVKPGGPMTGATLKAFYEKEWGTGVFVRGGIQHTRKILGGHTTSSVLGIQWYETKWDYSAVTAPITAGFKAGVSENVSVYMGGGMNYTSGFWSVTGTNVGLIPTGALAFGSLGLVPTTKNPLPFSTSVGNNLWGARIKFRASSVGFNFVTGIEKKMESGDKLFFEIEQLIAGGIGRRGLSHPTAMFNFAPIVAYPVNFSGTNYTFGYKMAM